MKENRLYETPVAEELQVFTEGILCVSDPLDGGDGGYLEDNDWGTAI